MNHLKTLSYGIMILVLYIIKSVLTHLNEVLLFIRLYYIIMWSITHLTTLHVCSYKIIIIKS